MLCFGFFPQFALLFRPDCLDTESHVFVLLLWRFDCHKRARKTKMQINPDRLLEAVKLVLYLIFFSFLSNYYLS